MIMYNFYAFSATFVLVLFIVVLYFYKGSKNARTIPGLAPSDEKNGNIEDIKRAKSLFEFLRELHKRYGDIASFWMGKEFIVSVASTELFAQQSKVFDRPASLFLVFMPLFGSDGLTYANGSDGRGRRNIYDRSLSHVAVSSHYDTLQKFGNELAQKLSLVPAGEHIPLREYLQGFTLKSIAEVLFGSYFNADETVLAFQKNFNICWTELEHRLNDGNPEKDSIRQKRFDTALEEIKEVFRIIVAQRRKEPPNENEHLLIDTFLQSGTSEERVLGDCISFTIGGFHSTGLLMTWCIYFLAKHQDIQQKAFKEIQDTLEGYDVTPESANHLIYLRQVLDETLRYTKLGPWVARTQNTDVELGGYCIPKNTPVIQALGIVLEDERYWQSPDIFDPDRFCEENRKLIPKFANEPFGFAGKRKCPGYRLSYAEATIFLVTLLRKFRFSLATDHVPTFFYGLVTNPGEEIWITVAKRNE